MYVPPGPFSCHLDPDNDTYMIQNYQGTVARVHFEWGAIEGSDEDLAKLICRLLNQTTTIDRLYRLPDVEE